ncbi:MAG: MMPL family transporter [Geminicoccaceae bacterium]
MSGTVWEHPWSLHRSTMERRPGLVLMVAFILVIASLVYSINVLRVDTSTTDMIAADVPFRQNETAFREAFPAFQESIVAVIDGDNPERSEDAARSLATALADQTEHFVNVDLPGDDPFFERHGLLYLELDALTDLSDRLAQAQPLLAVLAADPNLRGLADFTSLILDNADDPAAIQELDQLFESMSTVVDAAGDDRPKMLSWRSLLGMGGPLSGSRRLVLAEPALDYNELTPAEAAIGFTRKTAEELGITAANGLRLRLTGSAVIDHEELTTVSNGAIWAGLLATSGVALLLVWGLGSARLILATLLTLLAGLIITGGLATLLVGKLNLISTTFAVLFVGLGVDFGIHLVLRYKEAIDRRSMHNDAMRQALMGVGGPLTLSAVCAGLGFIAFMPTDYRGLAELGLISATGMVVAWASSLTILPALLDCMPLTPSQSPAAGRAGTSWISRHARLVLGLTLVAVVLSIPLLPRVAFDFNPLNLKDPASESVSTYLDLESDPNTAVNTIDAFGQSPAEADAIAAKLDALPGVGDVVTLSSFIPNDQPAKLDLIDAMAYFLGGLQPGENMVLGTTVRAEAFRALISTLDQARLDADSPPDRFRQSLKGFAEKTGADDQALADLEQRLTGYLPKLLGQLNRALEPELITTDTLPESLRSSWINAKGEARILARPAAGLDDNQDLAQFAYAALSVLPTATGVPVVVTEAGRAVVRSVITASWIALALILLVLITVLRRLRDVVIVLAPLFLSIVLVGATSVLLGIKLNFANVIVLPLLLGLGVSGAIHVMMRRRDLAGNAADGTTSSTSRAVFFSALTTIASFGSLAISAHQGMASMGLLLTVAISWSLVSTLIVLPAILAVFEQNPAPPPS